MVLQFGAEHLLVPEADVHHPRHLLVTPFDTPGTEEYAAYNSQQGQNYRARCKIPNRPPTPESPNGTPRYYKTNSPHFRQPDTWQEYNQMLSQFPSGKGLRLPPCKTHYPRRLLGRPDKNIAKDTTAHQPSQSSRTHQTSNTLNATSPSFSDSPQGSPLTPTEQTKTVSSPPPALTTQTLPLEPCTKPYNTSETVLA